MGNLITNNADTSFNAGGSTGIHVTAGLYANVSNNWIVGNNSGSRVLIHTASAGGGAVVIGNHVDNLVGTGVITLHANDIPTPAGTYNKLS